ncbi:BC1881 family protein [Bacillus cereus]|uniref:BC1881 family protein n=1 Tax=Bacillus cereus TaxID=1396 RepID=UPI000BEB4F96|nr:BC1881 family protein [Bacillus cereus]PEF60804.1 hypothetical protein CON35_28855 [Bacillus cereus]
MSLRNIVTKDICEELSKREEVMIIPVELHVKVEIAGVTVEGPTIILIYQD